MDYCCSDCCHAARPCSRLRAWDWLVGADDVIHAEKLKKIMLQIIPITDAMREPRKFPKVLTGVMLFLIGMPGLYTQY
jgi:hypothetical protein